MVLLRGLIIGVMLLGTTFSLCAQSSEQVLLKFKESYKYENDEKLDSAIIAIKSVYDETSYEMNLRLGWLYYSYKVYAESAKYYKKAVALFPYSEEAKMGYVLPLSQLNKWEEVKKVYQDILNINPKNATVLYRLGTIYYNQKEYYKANCHFKTLTDLYPFGYDGLLMFAWCNVKLGRTKEAKILFNKVLLYNPDDTSAKKGLALLQ